MLRYAVKHHLGNLEPSQTPISIFDGSKLAEPPKPGDIDCIVAGFPWYATSVDITHQRDNDTHSVSPTPN